MDVYEAIFSRRSITKFKPDPIPGEVLKRVFSAALWAPSKQDLQNWYFVVLGGSHKKNFLAFLQAEFARTVATAQPPSLSLSRIWTTEQFINAAERAPILVIAFSDKPINEDLDYGLSVAAAVQNLMLAAWSEGIGTRWYTYDLYAVKESICSYLGLEGKDLVGIIIMGYPEEIPEPTPRRERRIEWRMEP